MNEKTNHNAKKTNKETIAAMNLSHSPFIPNLFPVFLLVSKKYLE